MVLFDGRPESTVGRLPREIRVYDFLDSLGIKFKRVDHEAATTMAASVMGLMNDKDHVIQLLIDDDLKKDDYIGCHPCVCTSSMKIKSSDIFDIFLPAVGHEPEIVYLVGED